MSWKHNGLTETQLHAVREGEDAEAEIDEDGSFTDECERPHGLLHGDLCDGREVVVCVVGHDEAAEEDCHDPGQVNSLRQGVRRVDEAEHQRELQAGVGVQVDVLQHEGADQSNQRPDGSAAKEDSKEPGDSPSHLAHHADLGFALRLDDGGGENNGHGVIENTFSKHQHI